MYLIFDGKDNRFCFLENLSKRAGMKMSLQAPHSFVQAAKYSDAKKKALSLAKAGLVDFRKTKNGADGDGGFEATITQAGLDLINSSDTSLASLWGKYAAGFTPMKLLRFEGFSLEEAEVVKMLLQEGEMHLEELVQLYTFAMMGISVECNLSCIEFSGLEKYKAELERILFSLEQRGIVGRKKNRRFFISHNLLVHDRDMEFLRKTREKADSGEELSKKLSKKEQNALRRAKRTEELWEDLSYLRAYAVDSSLSFDGEGELLEITDEELSSRLVKDGKIFPEHLDSFSVNEGAVSGELLEAAVECGKDCSFFTKAVRRFVAENPGAGAINLEAAAAVAGVPLSWTPGEFYRIS